MAGRFSLEAIFTARDGTRGVTAKIAARFDRMTRAASRGLKALDGHIGTVHRSLVRIGGGMLLAGGAVGLVAKNIIDAGANFEQAISAVGAVSLLTRDQIGDLEKKALELGATTKFTATEAANGMELMAKAGFTNQEIIQGIGGVLNAAAAEGAELAETAGHVSNVLKGMGMKTAEASRVADVLTLASARTNSSISSLGESMANVSSTARQFKIPLEEAVGAVALLQDVGLDASVAGSAVNTMLTQMAAPSDAVKRKMKTMGVTFRDAKGDMLPLSDVLGQLDKAAKKSGGNMDQVAFFAELVGLRGQKAAANLKDLFASGKFGTLIAELKKAEGSAEKMAKLRMDNLKGDMTLLESAIDGVKVALFNTQSGPLRGVVQRMTEWVTANQGLIQSKVTQFIEDFVKNLPEIVKWIKRIATAVAVFYAIAAAVKVARVALAAYQLTVAAVALAKRGMAAASMLSVAGLRASGAAATAAAAPMLALAAAAGVALAALMLVHDQNEKMKKETGGLGVIDLVGEMWEQGTLDPFEAVDTHQNRLARRARESARVEESGRLNAQAPEAAEAIDALFRGFQPKGAFPGFGQPALQGGPQSSEPQLFTPADRTARTVKETITTSQSEVTIRDETGKAAITKQPKTGAKLKLNQSGAF